tara:strand:- start:1743 stop:1886 length:144 start_codon:yes stop_codon:yes gene_type:complete
MERDYSIDIYPIAYKIVKEGILKNLEILIKNIFETTRILWNEIFKKR